mmetsp:Transcript_3145/g.6512  ORF Transcript_3145/g.6512 Transcript_3145/m.6512 type:complete len:246 (-) Transcript_3145:1541-2278(-)
MKDRSRGQTADVPLDQGCLAASECDRAEREGFGSSERCHLDSFGNAHIHIPIRGASRRDPEESLKVCVSVRACQDNCAAVFASGDDLQPIAELYQNLVGTVQIRVLVAVFSPFFEYKARQPRACGDHHEAGVAVGLAASIPENILDTVGFVTEDEEGDVFLCRLYRQEVDTEHLPWFVAGEEIRNACEIVGDEVGREDVGGCVQRGGRNEVVEVFDILGTLANVLGTLSTQLAARKTTQVKVQLQ